jgi:hypothetical protein
LPTKSSPSYSEDFAIATRDLTVTRFEREVRTTQKVIAAFPDSQRDWEPDASARSAGDLAWHIKEAVNAALAAKGWTQVDSGGDVCIVAMEITRNQQTLNTFYDGFGGGWRWRGFGGFGEATTTTETYQVGTLVVDLFAAKSKNLIWRGSSSDTLSNNADKNTRNLDKGVQKMFEHFPPHAKK